MRKLRPTILVLSIVSLAACGDSDPVIPWEAPCDSPCLAKVAYLQLDSVQLISPTVPSTGGLPLAQPNDVRLSYRVRNVSDTTSSAKQVSITYMGGTAYDTVPSLAGGAVVRRVVQLDYGNVSWYRYSDRDSARFFMYAPRDSTHSYTSLTSSAYRVAIPLLSVSVVTDSQRVRVGQPLGGTYRIVNSSYYATSPAFRMIGCLADDFFGFCTPRYWTSFGSWNVPAIAPRGSATFTTSITVLPTAAWQDEDLLYWVHFCRVADTYNDPYLPYEGASCLLMSDHLLVRPDYEGTCTPPLLRAGVPAVLATYNCGIRPPTSQGGIYAQAGDTERNRFHLLALDATAGVTYRLTRSTGTQPLRFYDVDGFTQDDLDPALDRVRFAESGRKYLVLYSPQPALTVTLEVQ